MRNLDISNITFIEGDTGVIVIDPLISTEVAAAALSLYREHRGDREVVAVIHPDNAPSIAVAESVGFEHTGAPSEVHPTSEVWSLTRETYEADAAG